MAYGASSSVFHIRDGDDFYEVSFSYPLITRITCYLGGRHRQDVQFDDLQQVMKDKIVEKVKQLIKSNA